MALSELGGFVVVAPCAVPGRDHGGYGQAVVQVGIGVALAGHVAVVAADSTLGVGAAHPVRDYAGVLLRMAVHALLRAGGNGDGRLADPCLLCLPCRLHPLDEDQGEEEQPREGRDDDALRLESHVVT